MQCFLCNVPGFRFLLPLNPPWGIGVSRALKWITAAPHGVWLCVYFLHLLFNHNALLPAKGLPETWKLQQLNTSDVIKDVACEVRDYPGAACSLKSVSFPKKWNCNLVQHGDKSDLLGNEGVSVLVFHLLVKLLLAFVVLCLYVQKFCMSQWLSVTINH